MVTRWRPSPSTLETRERCPPSTYALPPSDFVRLIHCIAPQNYSVAANPGLRVDDRVSPDHGCTLLHLPADVDASKDDEDVPRRISLHLHRTEEAGGVMHLLAGSNEDILPDVSTAARRLAKRANRQQK